MQSQVALLSEKTSPARVDAVSRIAVAAALSLTCALSATFGCGSGTVQSIGSGSQSSAVPTASAQGPQLGYLWLDSDRTLRPILGVAGASQIGQSLVPAGAYVGAASHAAANIAILQDTDGSFDLMRLPSGLPASLSVKLPTGAAVRISPSAASALLYTPGTNSATLITNLLSTPQAQTVKLSASIVDSAVSDTGTIAAEYTQGSSIALAVTSTSGRSVPLANLGAAGGLSFLPGHDDLLFADGAANSATLVRSATSAPASSLVQTGSLLKSPSALGVSGSGRWALVVNNAANSATQTLVRIDLNTLTTVSVSCSCKPTEAAVLTDEGAFRVTNVKSGANWIVDASSSSPRTLFIPALPQTANTSLVAANIAP
ncbi:hypothetical protein [Granulicella aggregans]|jgi:hypothetical protein|uniref:hypothetical protein n=1 Tax=Granulicella aggregans TaxID=474949 RepID=UPI0021E094C3|nr:hypothetical protein [Granulicella aggregans]